MFLFHPSGILCLFLIFEYRLLKQEKKVQYLYKFDSLGSRSQKPSMHLQTAHSDIVCNHSAQLSIQLLKNYSFSVVE